MNRTKIRRDKLRKLLRSTGADALLATNFTNVTYLTGFTGDDSFLLLTADHAIVLSDPRYTQQLGEECPDVELEIRPPGGTLFELTAKTLKRAKIRRLAVESAALTLDQHEQIGSLSPGVELVGVTGLVEQLRGIKDREEIVQLRRAVRCAERAFGVIRASLRPEMTEKQIADELDHQVRLFGGGGCSFPPIVAAGPRAALPHATPTLGVIGEHDFLLLDWGAELGLYRSDLTRILVTGRISPKLERIYGVVFKAQQQAIASIKPGATLSQVDAAARNVIAKAGYGKNFGHGLGHGIGLDIHEAPRIAGNQGQPLRAGMVVTVEPGIYLPSWGGVRIEDDVLVTRNGHEVLSDLPRELTDCVVG